MQFLFAGSALFSALWCNCFASRRPAYIFRGKGQRNNVKGNRFCIMVCIKLCVCYVAYNIELGLQNAGATAFVV